MRFLKNVLQYAPDTAVMPQSVRKPRKIYLAVTCSVNNDEQGIALLIMPLCGWDVVSRCAVVYPNLPITPVIFSFLWVRPLCIFALQLLLSFMK